MKSLDLHAKCKLHAGLEVAHEDSYEVLHEASLIDYSVSGRIENLEESLTDDAR